MANKIAILEEDRTTLLEEAEAIENKASDENREPNEEEQARFSTIMNVELPRLSRQLAVVEAKNEDAKARALARLQEGREQVGGEEEPLLFRDAATGRTIRALRHDEKLSAAFSQSDPFDGATIDDGTPGGGRTRRAAEDRNLPYVGDLLCSMVTGNTLPDGRSVQAAIGGDDTSGGFLLQPTLGAQFIDLARSASVAFRAGARTLPMSTREVNLIRADGDPTAHWRAEGTKVEASDATFGRVTLRAKTLAVVVPASLELIEDSSNAANMITAHIRAAMGLQLDQAILRGSGAENQPLGVTNHAGVNVVSAVGTPVSYAEVTAAIGKIHQANFNGSSDELAWVQSPRDAETFDGLTADDGQPLRPTPWAEKLQRFTTTSMPIDLGAGSDESEAIIGDFSQVLVGMRTQGVHVRILDSGTVIDSAGKVHNAADELKKLIVCHLRADVAVLRPSWLTVLSGITNS